MKWESEKKIGRKEHKKGELGISPAKALRPEEQITELGVFAPLREHYPNWKVSQRPLINCVEEQTWSKCFFSYW